MKWLENYQKKIIIKQKEKVVRSVYLSSLSRIEKVGILWSDGEEKAFNFMQNYFRSGNVLVRNLCYTRNKEARESNMITRKDVNWLGFPKPAVYHSFVNMEFDLLLNVTVKTCYPLDFITALSVAKLKVGWDKNKTGIYDLSVELSGQPDPLYLAEQQIYLLQQLNKNN